MSLLDRPVVPRKTVSVIVSEGTESLEPGATPILGALPPFQLSSGPLDSQGLAPDMQPLDSVEP